MKRVLLFGLLLGMIAWPLQAQVVEPGIPISISFSNNATQLFSSGLTVPIHPGLTLGTQTVLKETRNGAIYQTFQLGWYYHAYSMHGWNLYSEVGYGRKLIGDWGLRTQIGTGYLLSLVDLQTFERTELGSYALIPHRFRSQFTAGASLGTYYQLSGLPMTLSLDYRFWIQAPFVKNYVPVLPNTSLHLGLLFHLFQSR